MRSYLPDFDLQAPGSLEDALALIAREPGQWRPFAGGTDLMVLLEAGALTPSKYLSLWQLRDLRGIMTTDDEVVIGALTTYSDVMRSDVLSAEFPLMGLAAAETGGVATQNRGTIGGNIANASPAADTPPALLVYDAAIDLVSVRGVRRVAYDRFHLGYKQIDLAPDELIHSIRLPRGRAGWRHSWKKIGTRRAQAISKVCFAAAIDVAGVVVRDLRIALGSVAPTPVRAARAEAAMRGRAIDAESIKLSCAALAADISPIDDVRSTARYRLTVARNLLEQFLSSTVG
jgi:CO/xanthine dehydrogenase FAD-binding subunit